MMGDISVLLVDDEQGFVDALARRLKMRGFKPAAALSGQQALDKLEGGGASTYDVVVLDVKMPGMDGLETLAVIKEKHPLVEVIMLTGHATVESAIDGMKQGAFDYLMKPCDMDVLTDKLQQAATSKRGHEAKILEARATLIAMRRGD
jgi:DNA-binding NtrC family response regulator